MQIFEYTVFGIDHGQIMNINSFSFNINDSNISANVFSWIVLCKQKSCAVQSNVYHKWSLRERTTFNDFYMNFVKRIQKML